MINTMASERKNAEGKLTNVILFFAIFAIGFFVALALNSYFSNSLEHPFSYSISSDVKSPSDSIKENQILIYNDKIVVNIEDASLSAYAPTGSMLPVLDEGANGIIVTPKSEDEISVGDIVTYKKDSMLIVHRVAEKGTDNEGVYFITQGDNNNYADGKIRFSDIKYKTIGILY